ncbi:MAG: malonate decarboxylase acyl carrier protein [Oligosphaeraceae bacterium]|nr:malonate decarboxylase acyl carrier protein [Oligosphaeraceae bacterium]
MEHLQYDFKEAGGETRTGQAYVLTGVVASGNLEVMMQPQNLSGACRFVIDTAANGFAASWQAVLEDFMRRHRPANLLVSINDHAASPAVVSLRIDQAYELLTEK